MTSNADPIRAFVTELLRSGIMLADVLADLLEDLPDDAFPGEETAEVLLDMVTGSIQPAAQAFGVEMVREATALIGASADRVLQDLHAAADLARARDAGLH